MSRLLKCGIRARRRGVRAGWTQSSWRQRRRLHVRRREFAYEENDNVFLGAVPGRGGEGQSKQQGRLRTVRRWDRGFGSSKPRTRLVGDTKLAKELNQKGECSPRKDFRRQLDVSRGQPLRNSAAQERRSRHGDRTRGSRMLIHGRAHAAGAAAHELSAKTQSWKEQGT